MAARSPHIGVRTQLCCLDRGYVTARAAASVCRVSCRVCGEIGHVGCGCRLSCIVSVWCRCVVRCFENRVPKLAMAWQRLKEKAKAVCATRVYLTLVSTLQSTHRYSQEVHLEKSLYQLYIEPILHKARMGTRYRRATASHAAVSGRSGRNSSDEASCRNSTEASFAPSPPGL